MPISIDDRAGVATLTTVAASASSVSIAAPNNARKGLIVMNDSSAICYLAYAASASTSTYTTQIPAGVCWEMPPVPLYQGAVSAIWSAAAGNARVTEL